MTEASDEPFLSLDGVQNMHHDYSCRYRICIRGICAMAFVLLSACSTHTFQGEKGREAFKDGPEHQARLNQLYRLRVEATIWGRPERQAPYEYLPYTTYCGSRADSCSKVVTLPAGTIIELVGVNEYHQFLVGTWTTLIFAVHDHPELDTLLFEWDTALASITLTGGRYSRLEQVRGNSCWTPERLGKIASAEWVRKRWLNIRKLVVKPASAGAESETIN